MVVCNFDGSIVMQLLCGNDLGCGGDLFWFNCVLCYNFIGKGGVLLFGKYVFDFVFVNEQ